MFYLVQFFDSFKRHPFRGAVLAFLTISLLTSAGLHSTIDKNLQASYKKAQSEPYFHALLSSKENASRLQRKIVQLPGVKRVILLGEKQVKDRVNQMMAGFSTNMNTDLLNLEYTGLKVVLSSDLKNRSVDLIRNYMGRLVGKDKLTLGAVKGKNSAKQIKQAPFFIEWGAWICVGSLFLLWVLSALSFNQELKRDAYLIEQFQRRTQVSLKTYSVGMLSLIGLTLGGLVLASSVQWIMVVAVSFILLAFGLTQLKQYSWVN